MASHRLLIISYLYLKYLKRRHKRRHCFWIRRILTERNRLGDGNQLINELRLGDLQYHLNYLRMTSKQFDVLLGMIGPQIQKSYLIREPIDARIRLAVTLRYLASGDSMISLSYSYRIGKSTMCKIIHECIECIWECLSDKVFLSPDKHSWQQVAEEFYNQWNFPNCIGAIDGKHITLEAPACSGSTYYNYKGHHSIVLMAACDANYFFTIVDIGAPGRYSDGGIFRNSIFGQSLEKNALNLPDPKPLPNQGPKQPYVFVGDEAFQLTHYMMRPYPRTSGLTREKRVFNYRLSRARRVIENTFGILSAKWRIFRRPINTEVKTAENIVKAAVCLHNFIKIMESKTPADKTTYQTAKIVDTGDGKNGEWRNMTGTDGMQNVKRTGSHYSGLRANEIREKFKIYFCNEGAVDWQWEKADNAEF